MKSPHGLLTQSRDAVASAASRELTDFNAGTGGPVRKDRLCFYTSYRYEALDSSVVDTFYNKRPVWYLYQPDFDRPAHDTGSIPNVSIRLTWQASGKDKVTGWFTQQAKQRPFYNVGGWYDIFEKGILDGYTFLHDHGAPPVRNSQRLMLAAFGHGPLSGSLKR